MSDICNLTPLEAELCEDLLSTLRTHNLSTVLRIAGGWVRDKLLGLESHDIDITLSDMTGEEFAKLFSQNGNTGSIGKIRANPEASKHLETACIRYKTIELDLVNLRAEDYTEDSRIPSIKIGTPLEDALRRDLTINSLFYNINTREVEDLTGLGIADLRNKIARTPLDPLSTFMDDPLRVLRTVRFAARFELEILPEVQKAINEPQVLQVLLNKISRERISKEYSLMLKGNNHLRALRFLHEFKLFTVIFKVPQQFPNLLDQGYELVQRINRPRSDRNHLLYTAGLLAGYALEGEFMLKDKKKDMKVYEYICIEQLKLSNFESSVITAVLNNLSRFIKLVRAFDVLEMAEILRELKENWDLCVTLAAYCANAEQAETIITHMMESVTQAGIDRIWEEKPLLNGNELKELLNIKGKEIGHFAKECLKWQTLNRGSNKEDLIIYLKSLSISNH